MSQDLFGGSKNVSTSSSSNQAFPYLQKATEPGINNGNAAGGQIANMLGLNGGSAQNEGFNNWRNSTGYQFGMDQGMQAITGGAATKGLLNSGGTAKALETYGQDYANTKYQDYLNPLQNLMSNGNQNAGVLSSAGNISSSYGSGSNKPGMGGFIGSILSKGA